MEILPAVVSESRSSRANAIVAIVAIVVADAPVPSPFFRAVVGERLFGVCRQREETNEREAKGKVSALNDSPCSTKRVRNKY